MKDVPCLCGTEESYCRVFGKAGKERERARETDFVYFLCDANYGFIHENVSYIREQRIVTIVTSAIRAHINCERVLYHEATSIRQI